jgi:hypothetical protein
VIPISSPNQIASRRMTVYPRVCGL